MKKLIAMILALTTAAGLSVTAVAETAVLASPAPGALSISYDKSKDGITLAAETVLTPNETYYFPILVTENGVATAKDLSTEQFKNFKFSFQNEDGKGAIESIKIEKYKTRYSLAIKTRVPSITKLHDVSYTIKVMDKSANQELFAAPVSFQVGYPAMPDNAVLNPDFVEVDPKTPVITADQFAELDSEADGGAVTLMHDDWEFAVKVRGMKDTNLHTDSDDIDAILEKYPQQEFKFVTFTYGPAFRTEGTLTIDVSNDMDLFGSQFHVYMYDQGKLVPMKATLNEEKETLSLTTKQLGRFVITNKAISSLTVGGSSGSTGGSDAGNTGNTGSNGSAGNTGSSGATGDSSQNGTVPNPGTGAGFVAPAFLN